MTTPSGSTPRVPRLLAALSLSLAAPDAEIPLRPRASRFALDTHRDGIAPRIEAFLARLP